MTNRKVAVAVLCGAGFTSLVLLLIKLSSPSVIALFLGLPLLPGGAIAHFLARSQDIDPPLLVLAANAIVYAGIAYAALRTFGAGIAAEKMRSSAIKLAFPVAVLVGLVCVPVLNPLWPRGMVELTRQEKNLQDAFPLGTGVDEARTVLRSKAIRFQEQIMSSDTVVVDRPEKSITAAAGDRVISARLETQASQFPCGYDIEIVLLFGPNEKLKDQYVRRLRLCP
jgi:hypothetical protein